jgi:hypothetical protein
MEVGIEASSPLFMARRDSRRTVEHISREGGLRGKTRLRVQKNNLE